MSKEQKELFKKIRTCVQDAAFLAKNKYSNKFVLDTALYAINIYTRMFTKSFY